MERSEFNKFVENIGYQKFKYYSFREIESIIFKNGIGVYPNWKKMKFMITDDEILVLHGKLEPYGGRIKGLINFSGVYDYMMLNMSNRGLILDTKSFYGRDFRPPRDGDTLRLTLDNKMLSENMIKDVKFTMNTAYIYVYGNMKPVPGLEISYYDTDTYLKNNGNLYHSEFEEGVYMKFVNNDESKLYKKQYPYHDIIKIKHIKDIYLSLESDNGKTYKLEAIR